MSDEAKPGSTGSYETPVLVALGSLQELTRDTALGLPNILAVDPPSSSF